MSAIHERGVTITLDGSQRRVQLAGEDLDSLRLAYAQHVYRQQGATVERSVVLTGGWQTSKETAYVEATRARHGTDWFIARDDLGTEGQDAARITRLAQKMCNSRAKTPSLAHPELPDRTTARASAPRSRPAAPAAYQGSSARSTALPNLIEHPSECDEQHGLSSRGRELQCVGTCTLPPVSGWDIHVQKTFDDPRCREPKVQVDMA